MEGNEDPELTKELEKRFCALSYEEIERVLADINMIFFVDDIRTIPKQEIFVTMEWDYPLATIENAIRDNAGGTEQRTAR